MYRSNRNGIALMVAIFAIVIIGLAVAGAHYASTQEFRVARNSVNETRAFAASEFGHTSVLTEWNAGMVNLAQGDTLTRFYPNVEGDASATVRFTRLNQGTFWVVSEGVAGVGTQLEARRRTGTILRLDIPTVRVLGAVTTRLGEMSMSGTATMNGADNNPPGWDCPSTGPAVAGLAVPDTTAANYSSSSSVPITGAPPVSETSVAADTSTYSNFGSYTYESLAAMATLVYTGNASSIFPSLDGGGNCNTANTKNWGEPWRPPTAGTVPACQDYFPIIHATPATFQFSSGRGQGILLVDGDFVASGGTEFKGLIVVKGKFTTSGGGIKVHGALLARNIGNAKNTMSGSTNIQFSRCAIQTVLARAASRPRLAPSRAWADMF